MEIRAKLALEISKFKANVAAVVGSFENMTTGARRHSENVDKYIDKNLKNRLDSIEQIKKAEQKAIQFTEAQQAQAAKKKSGSTALTFTSTSPTVTPALFDSRVAMQYQSKITQAERAATAERVAIAQQANAKKLSDASKSEEERYKNWLKINTKQDAVARGLADKEKNYRDSVAHFNSKDFESNLASTRYAIYDIANNAAVFGTAMAASLGMAVKAAMDFESAFTSVERTTSLALNSLDAGTAQAAQRLRSTLIELSTQIPVTFQEIAQIATLGAQLGIAADSVDEFANTVAKFSAITGLAVDEVGMSFGRLAQLMNVPVSEFENLSSAIAYTGVNSVATDQEILRMSESISAATTQAGLAADETIGFAAALASLKVRPEEARGVLTRLFREFDLSVTAGGSKLDDLGRVIGRTSTEAAELWKQDPTAFVQAFLKGSQATGQLNEIITALGITNTRELNVISRLAQNQDVLTRALSDSAEQYAAGTYASESYGLVVDDLASKLTMLQSEIAAFGASIGQMLEPFIKPVVDALREFVGFLTELPTPIKFIGTVIVALSAGLALLGAMLGGGIAALLALRLAMDNLSIGGHKASLSIGTFRALLISLLPNAGAATTVVGALGNSLKATAVSFGIASTAARGFMMALGAIGIVLTTVMTVQSIIEDTGNKAEEAKRKFFDAAGGATAFSDALKKDQEAIAAGAKSYGEIVISASKLSEAEQQATLAAKKAAVERAKANIETEGGTTAYYEAVNALTAFEDQMKNANDAVATNTLLIGDNTRALIVNSMAEFWDALAGLDPKTKASLEAAGFDAGAMIDAGLAKAGGAQEYLSSIKIGLEDIAPQDLMFFGNVDSSFLPTQDIWDYAEALDGTTSAIENGTTAESYRQEALGASADATAEGEDAVNSLNEQIKALVSGLGAEESANQKVTDSFNDMIQGMEDTSGEMHGMSKAARDNMDAFKSFMDSAVEAAIATGEGVTGAASRVASGLNTMAQEGYDTADAFSISKDLFVNAFYEMTNASADAQININGKMVSIREALANAGSLEGLKKIINAFYATKIAAEGASGALYVEWSRAIASISGTTTVDDDLNKTTKSAGKAKTALEKLQETLKKLYSWTNKKIALNESIASLGDSMRENGRTFSVWSEAGRENVGSLLDVIDQLAIESNGDLKKFANSLASMRAALVQSGAPASALKFIDDALKKIGKSGKATTKQIQQFVNVLGSAGDEISTLQAVNAAIADMASSMRDQFDAYFYQSDLIDQITLGWLDLADAADAAREQIRNAEESIRDARLEIEASKAAIDKLTANKGTLQYQLAIALKYGDTLRADELKAEIADLEAQIAEERNNIVDSQGDIADAQQEIADANGELGSNPTARQQIERNQLLRDMAGRYLDVASAALYNAEEGADLNVIMEDQIGSFIDMAREAGFTEEEIMSISGVMRDVLTKAINDIPKNPKVTVSSETSAALQKVKKFVQDANAALANINSVSVSVNTGGSSTAPGTGGGTYLPVARGGLIVGPGTGTSDSIAARVSNGEFVVKAAAVRRYGVDFMNAINNMQSYPMARMNVPAVAGSGSQTVYLSTEDRQLLRAAIDRPIALYTDNATIAKSANDGNRILAKRGTR